MTTRESSLFSHLDPVIDALVPGVLDENFEQVFMFGYCSLFAQALHDLTGWPVVEVDDDNFHCGVIDPEGRILDAQGFHDADDWAVKHRGAWHPTWNPNYRATFYDGVLSEASMRVFAEALLAAARDGRVERRFVFRQ